MKKIFLVLIAAVALLLGSCEGNKRCPAYDSIEDIDVRESNNSLIKL